MIINTDRLAELCFDFKGASDALGIIDLQVENKMRRIIDDEMTKKFGRGLIYYASSHLAVAGLDKRDDIIGNTIEEPPFLIGVNPVVESIVYNHGKLFKEGLIPSLIFETCETTVATDEIGQGVAQLYPYAALPLTELHHIEAIGIDTRNG